MKLPGHWRENVFLGRPNETRRRLLKGNNWKDGERKEKWEGGGRYWKEMTWKIERRGKERELRYWKEITRKMERNGKGEGPKIRKETTWKAAGNEKKGTEDTEKKQLERWREREKNGAQTKQESFRTLLHLLRDSFSLLRRSLDSLRKQASISHSPIYQAFRFILQCSGFSFLHWVLL